LFNTFLKKPLTLEMAEFSDAMALLPLSSADSSQLPSELSPDSPRLQRRLEPDSEREDDELSHGNLKLEDPAPELECEDDSERRLDSDDSRRDDSDERAELD